MQRIKIFSAAASLLILLSGTNIAQENNHMPRTVGKKLPVTVTHEQDATLNQVNTKDFKYTDIGNPAISGIVKVSDAGFDITAGGADIWGEKDKFNFVYIEKTGDFDFAARVESLTAAHQYTKAGLMAREKLIPGSRHVYF